MDIQRVDLDKIFDNFYTCTINFENAPKLKLVNSDINILLSIISSFLDHNSNHIVTRIFIKLHSTEIPLNF